ncbi:MAG: SelL-related redox protein [Terracidiphilus sp.]
MPPATAPLAEQEQVVAVLRAYRTETGRSLLEVVDESPVLLIFLRHFGCAFCRQALDQVAQIRVEIATRGAQPVFVHLGSPERAKPYFDYYQLSSVERVSNPDASLYQHPVFALSRMNPYLNLLSLKVWKKWLSGALRKYGIGRIQEDGHQMPGVFFLKERRIVRGFRYQTIADEPDYLKLIGPA